MFKYTPPSLRKSIPEVININSSKQFPSLGKEAQSPVSPRLNYKNLIEEKKDEVITVMNEEIIAIHPACTMKVANMNDQELRYYKKVTCENLNNEVDSVVINWTNEVDSVVINLPGQIFNYNYDYDYDELEPNIDNYLKDGDYEVIEFTEVKDDDEESEFDYPDE
jgi:hypothetical protein